MNKVPKFSPEVLERAVRMVQVYREDYPYLREVVEQLVPKYAPAPYANEWMRKHQVDSDVRQSTTIADEDRLKAVEPENRELRKANEILKLASSYLPRHNSTAV